MTTYTVQTLAGDEWIDCVREDLIEDMDGDTRTLPVATFDTDDEARTFIDVMCGLMHCGGDPNDFRVVSSGWFTEPMYPDATKAETDGNA